MRGFVTPDQFLIFEIKIFVIMDRRYFIRSSALGTAGSLLSSHSIKSRNNSRQQDRVIKRKLGKTGIELPIISMGVMRLDNPSSGCIDYRINCIENFNIPDKINDILCLKDIPIEFLV